MKHKKTLVAIILCLVLIFSLFALVACGETNDSNANNDNDTSNNPASDIVDFIEHAISYGKSSFEYYSVGGSLVKYDSSYYDDLEGGPLCSITVQLSPQQNQSYKKTCYFELYNSEMDATVGMSIQQDDIPNKRQNGKILISESEVGLYDEIMSSTPETELPFAAIIAFTKNSISSSLTSNGTTAFGYIANTSYVKFTLYAPPIIDDYTESYFCTFESESIDAFEAYCDTYIAEFNSKIGTEYTTDSYAKLENGVLYSYHKIAPQS